MDRVKRQRGQIIFLKGSKQHDHGSKPRPAVIIQSSSKQSTIVPLTSKPLPIENWLRVPILKTEDNRLEKSTSWAMLDGIGTRKNEDIADVFGVIEEEILAEIDRRLAEFLHLSYGISQLKNLRKPYCQSCKEPCPLKRDLESELKYGEIVKINDDRDYIVIIQSCKRGRVTGLSLTSNLINAPLLRVTVQPSEQNGLKKISQVMIDNIQTYSLNNIEKVFGHLEEDILSIVDERLAVFLGLRPFS